MQLCESMSHLFVEPQVIVPFLAGVMTKIIQTTSSSELHNRISKVSRLSFSLLLSHWLWSGVADVRGKEVAMEMGATVAF